MQLTPLRVLVRTETDRYVEVEAKNLWSIGLMIIKKNCLSDQMKKKEVISLYAITADFIMITFWYRQTLSYQGKSKDKKNNYLFWKKGSYIWKMYLCLSVQANQISAWFFSTILRRNTVLSYADGTPLPLSFRSRNYSLDCTKRNTKKMISLYQGQRLKVKGQSSKKHQWKIRLTLTAEDQPYRRLHRSSTLSSPISWRYPWVLTSYIMDVVMGPQVVYPGGSHGSSSPML